MKSRALLAAAVALPLLWTLATPTSSRAADDTAQLPSLEKSLWEAWKNHDPAPFEKNLDEGAMSTGSGGLDVGRAKVVGGLKDCVVASYSLGEIAVHRFGDSTAILTYSATQDATCKGKKVAAKVLASSVWFKQGGSWRNAAYHESPAPQ